MVRSAGTPYIGTDDAFVDANKLMVSSDVSGTVAEVDVKEGQTVHKGDVLFRLDPKPFQIALQQAQSNLALLTAPTIKSMEQDYQRMLSDIEAQRAQVQRSLETTPYSAEFVASHGGTAQQNVDQAQATRCIRRNRRPNRSQQQAEVQLAKLGGRIGSPVESHPEYKQQGQRRRDEAPAPARPQRGESPARWYRDAGLLAAAGRDDRLLDGGLRADQCGCSVSDGAKW